MTEETVRMAFQLTPQIDVLIQKMILKRTEEGRKVNRSEIVAEAIENMAHRELG